SVSAELLPWGIERADEITAASSAIPPPERERACPGLDPGSATPVCGKRLAQTIASGKTPDLIKPFALDRFANFVQIGERGAASVGH
ncbi:MAG: hypothetical protein WBZ51_38010, partial [Xanthobacteraceae bacterium]